MRGVSAVQRNSIAAAQGGAYPGAGPSHAGEAAQRIRDVVRLVGDIAGQTNLLALNATIEAARAGEAGKGFAVVAGEVKALATQTARATEEIAAQVNAIQATTGQAVQSIKGIAEVVGEVDQIAAAIAAAVEEQSATAREIARDVTETARGTNDVSANIVPASAGVEATNGALLGFREATGTVARQGGTLREEFSGLLTGLWAA
ncbi:methyl-accepting chemotaxis protein [Paracraurococcus lichenis]|uniref:Methyl-accepting chemotaxis protein n=1 Tax=Paracraurococcus lichenis TaxID=3064888 RepID=A0ABT9E6Y5_9PROT|nr:methyl-accepting chemotaxis protein [Paracraurococcus sp. LOR1-02]MDO9711947.1 methyl-accepting chemotaxis protein [Paracraurococcus sp. LOR1-02]